MPEHSKPADPQAQFLAVVCVSAPQLTELSLAFGRWFLRQFGVFHGLA